MTDKEIREFIPTKFKIVNHTITVKIEECGSDDTLIKYGQWCMATTTITLYRYLLDDKGNEIPQTKEQLMSTFYHELFHCFFDFQSWEQSESDVQALSNMMVEYIDTMVFE